MFIFEVQIKDIIMLTMKIMLIYKITNTINNKIYIGQTSRSIEARWSDYKRDVQYVKQGSKLYRPIIASMQKYGFDKFTIEILKDNINSMDELNNLEQTLIKEYDSTNPDIGYNVELGGNGIGKHSFQTKLKISNAQKGNLNHMFGKIGKENAASKPIIDLTTGIVYESAMQASKQLNIINWSHICAVARGQKTSCNGKIFRYVDIHNNPIYVKPPTNIISTLSIIDVTNHIIYDSLKEAAEANNVTQNGIRIVCKGQRKFCNGIQYKFGEYNSKEVLAKSAAYNNVLEEYKYLINIVPSSNNLEKV